MRPMRFPIIAGFAVLLTLTAPAPATAQNTRDQFEVAFQSREAQRRATISSAMNFTEEEATVFWPIYDLYRFAAKDQQRRRLKLLQQFSQNAVGTDPIVATEIIDAGLVLDAEEVTARNEYIAKLAQHFEGPRYFRIFQLETRLDAIFRAGWTSSIPLAVTEKELEALQMGMSDSGKDQNKDKKTKTSAQPVPST